PTPDVPPHASQSHRHPDAQAYALVCVAARTPETPRPTILEPIAHLRADAEPAEWSPLDPATDAPLRRELLRGRVSREAERPPPPPPALRGQHRREEEERREPPAFSQQRQWRAALPTRAAPCDGTGDAAPAA